MNVRIATCSTAILLALAAPAYAEVMTIEYSGTLGAGQDWPAGVVVSGSVTYDTDAVPTFTSSIFANYPIISGTAELNGAVFVSGTGHIQVRNNAPDTPTIYVDTISINMQAIGTFAGRTVRSIGATLHHAASSPPATLDSVALPDGDENLAAFTNRSVSVGYFDASNNISNVNGPLSNIAFVIEEPPILATSCDGFYTPFDEPLSLPRKSRRTIPLTL